MHLPQLTSILCFIVISFAIYIPIILIANRIKSTIFALLALVVGFLISVNVAGITLNYINNGSLIEIILKDILIGNIRNTDTDSFITQMYSVEILGIPILALALYNNIKKRQKNWKQRGFYDVFFAVHIYLMYYSHKFHNSPSYNIDSKKHERSWLGRHMYTGGVLVLFRYSRINNGIYN